MARFVDGRPRIVVDVFSGSTRFPSEEAVGLPQLAKCKDFGHASISIYSADPASSDVHRLHPICWVGCHSSESSTRCLANGLFHQQQPLRLHRGCMLGGAGPLCQVIGKTGTDIYIGDARRHDIQLGTDMMPESPNLAQMAQ